MSNEIKKILIDCERMKYPNTGLYHYCLQLVQALAQKVHPQSEQLQVYVRPGEHGIFGEDVTYIAQHSLHKFLMPSTGKFDIWHATYQGTMYYPNGKRLKKVLTVHDINFMYDEAKAANKQKKYLQQLAKKIQQANHVVFISSFVQNDVKQYIDLTNIPHSVIYNGCNIKEMPNNLQQPQVLPDSPFLFTIGTVIEKKNFHVLPRMLQNSPYKLVIAGVTQSSNYVASIKAEAEKFGVADRVIFTGPISENNKMWYYKNCTAFVFPSLAEGFGLPVIEAMYFGKPVILSNKTSLPEIGGPFAAYFENFEPEHMQIVTNEYLANCASNVHAADECKNWAKQFNWSSTAEAYWQVYRSLY